MRPASVRLASALLGLVLLGAPALSQQWHTVPSLEKARYAHTATPLPNGDVLVAGGGQYNTSNLVPGTLRTVHKTTELFTAGGFWRNGPDMLEPRLGHTATLLPDGEVLVVGGTATPSAEIYSPVTNAWRSAPLPAVARSFHTATLLRDGRVLFAGGSTDGRVELYDPATASWSSVTGSNVVRALHTATLLPDGRVLLLAGLSDPTAVQSGIEGFFLGPWFSAVDATSDLFDPATDTLSTGPSLSQARVGHATLVLHDLRLVVLGGTPFDPQRAEWLDATNPAGGFSDLGFDTFGSFPLTQLLPTGTVVIASGASAALGYWDGPGTTGLLTPAPGGDVLAPLPPLSTSQDFTGRLATLTPLPSGKLLLAGGLRGNNDTDATVATGHGAWLFDPEGGWEQTSWQLSSSSLTGDHYQHTVDLLSSGNLLVVSGTDSELVDLSGPEPTPAPAGMLLEPRQNHTATVLPEPSVLGESQVLVAGGEWNSTALGSIEVYGGEGASPAWTSAGSLLEPRTGHTATLLASGEILFAGGTGSGSAEIYDPKTGGSRPTGAMRVPRSGHSAQLLPGGEVLVVGGSTTYLSEIYDPHDVDPSTGRRGRWRDHYDLAAPRFIGSPFLGLLPSQEAFVAGSTADGTFSRQSEILTSSGWLPAGQHGSPRRIGPGMTSLPTGQVFLSEGQDPLTYGFMSDMFFDVQTFAWTNAKSHSLGYQQSFFELNVGTRDWIVKTGGCTDPAPLGSPCMAQLDDLQYRSLEAIPFAEPAPLVSSINGVASAPYPRPVRGEPLVLELPRRAIDFRSGGGATNSSDSSAPLFRLESLESGQSDWLVPTSVDWNADPQTYTFSGLPDRLEPGWYALSVTARGRVSERYLLNFRGNLQMLRDGFESGDLTSWSAIVP